MHPSLLYHRGGKLTATELSALRLDGLLHEVGDAFLPADVPETAQARMLALAPLLRAEFVVSGPSAAWVHGAGDAPPPRCHVRPCGPRRLRPPSDSRLRFHESVVPDSEIATIAGHAVLSLAATAVDLARTADPHRRWLVDLARIDPSAITAAECALRERRRLPGKNRAIAALQEAYDEVTR